MTTAQGIVKTAISNGFDEAVANVYYNRRSYLKIANSKIDSIVDKYTAFGGLFVSSKKRLFFTNIDRIDDKSITEAIKRAKSAMKFILPKDDYFGIAEGPYKYKKDTEADKSLEHYNTKAMEDIAAGALNSAVENGAKRVAGALFIAHMRSELATSKKVSTRGEETLIRLSLRVFNNVTSFQNFACATHAKQINEERFGKETAEMLSSAAKIDRLESGKYDVIYLPSPGGSLVSNVNDAACISSIETGSFLPKKPGAMVANRKITVYDCGMLKGSVDSSPYDDEGYPTQKTKIIENGIMKNHLHNFSTAKKYHTTSTGNAGLVSPSPQTMLFVHKEKVKSVDELIRKIDKGILVTNTWYTRFSNYVKGDFSTVPRDLTLYIENGEVKFAIRQKEISSIVGIRISDNMLRMLKNTEYAANDTKQTTSWDSGNYYFMPSVLVRNVEVTAV